MKETCKSNCLSIKKTILNLKIPGMVLTTIVPTTLLIIYAAFWFFSRVGKNSSKNALMNGFTEAKQYERDQQPYKISNKSSANLRFSSFSSCFNALLDAGMSPKQTDAEQWIDILETNVQREKISCCQTCLRILFVVRTFWLTAKQQKYLENLWKKKQGLQLTGS